MTYYVAHKYNGKFKNYKRAKRITHELQTNDLENVYVCPLLVFSHLQYGELGYEAEMELCKDLIVISDKLIVASDVSRGVQEEIDFAKKIGMEIEYLEKH